MTPLILPTPTEVLGTGRSDRIVIGTGLSVPSGIAQPIEFNGLILNNRRWIDTYIVEKISGLSDSVIRDDRENNPQADGETAFDAYYGGKTFTLTGRIRVFNKDKLDDMATALRAAFHDIKNEKPMTFYARNPAAVSMIMCKKGAELVLDDEQTNDHDFSRAFMITMKASNPRILSRTELYGEAKFGFVDNFSTDTLAQYTFDTGSGTLGVSGNKLVPSSNAAKSFRKTDQPNYIDTEMVVGYRYASSAASSEIRLCPRYIDNQNHLQGIIDASGKPTIAGLWGNAQTVLAAGSNYSRTAGTFYWVKFKALGNLLTLSHYTEDPRVNPAATAIETVSFTIVNSTHISRWGAGVTGKNFFYFKPSTTGFAGWEYDDISSCAVALNAATILSLPNAGNDRAQPVITLNGPMTGPILTNVANSESLALTKSGGDVIAAADYRKIDIAGDTLVDSSDNKKWSKLTISSDWMELEPGYNSILLTASGMGVLYVAGNWIVPSVNFLYRSTWT